MPKTKIIIFAIASLFATVGITGCSLFGVKLGNVTSGSKVPGGGVYKSYDQGETWQAMTLVRQEKKKIVSIDKLHVIDIKMDPQDPFTLYLVSKYNGLWVTYNAGENWQQIVAPPVSALATHAKERKIIYVTRANQIFKSTDGGNTWRSVFLESLNYNIDAMVVDRSTPDRVLAATELGSIFESINGGASWRNLSSVSGKVVDLIVHPLDSRIIYVATEQNGVYKTVDGGISWLKLDSLSQFSGAEFYGDLAVDNSDKYGILHGSEYGLLKSTDGGITFRTLSLLTPETSAKVDAVVFDPSNHNQIYYVSNGIFYKTLDGGNTWITRSLPLDRNVSTILIDPADPRTIYIGMQKLPAPKKTENRQSGSSKTKPY